MLDKNSARSKDLTAAIAKMIVLDCQPFSVVNDRGFREIIKIAEPRYAIPERATFAEHIVPKMFEEVKVKLQETIDH